jgi:hypothetical protein
VERIPAVLRSPPKAKATEVLILSEESMVPRRIMSPERIYTNNGKLKAVWEWLIQRNKHVIRSFLGICTYYRQFTSGFANTAKLLTKLMKVKQAFQWTPEVEAFQTLKETLGYCLYSFLLAAKRDVLRFIDVSNVRIGTML